MLWHYLKESLQNVERSAGFWRTAFGAVFGTSCMTCTSCRWAVNARIWASTNGFILLYVILRSLRIIQITGIGTLTSMTSVINYPVLWTSVNAKAEKNRRQRLYQVRQKQCSARIYCAISGKFILCFSFIKHESIIGERYEIMASIFPSKLQGYPKIGIFNIIAFQLTVLSLSPNALTKSL